MSDVDMKLVLQQLDELLAMQRQQMVKYQASADLEVVSNEPRKEERSTSSDRSDTPQNPVPNERTVIIQNITNSLCAMNPDQNHESLGRIQLRAKNLEAFTEPLGHNAVPQVDTNIRHPLDNEDIAQVQPVELAVSSVSTSTSSDHHTGLSQSIPGLDRCPSPPPSDAIKLVDNSSRANTGLDAHPWTVATRTFRKLSTQYSHHIVFQRNRLLPEPPAARELQHLAEGGSPVTALQANFINIKSTCTDRGPKPPWSSQEVDVWDPGPSASHSSKDRIHHPANLLKGEM